MKYLEFYKKNNNGKYEKMAFQYLVTDLLKDNLTGDDKKREITGLDIESRLYSNFVPSEFYIFLYFNGETNTVDGEKFYDNAPVILCTGADQSSVTGINFNYVPNDVRAAFLDIISGSYESFYENLSDDGLMVNGELGAKLANKDNLSSVLSLLKEKLGVDLRQCIRTYNRKKILKSRMIEKDMWQYIPFLSFRDAVRGVNLAKVQLSLLQNR